MSDATNDILLSIIIPAYNEEGAIGSTILTIHDLELPSYEIVVVDDGSSDATARVAATAGARVVSHPYNIGNGAAVKTGIRSARGRVLVFMDGDGQHDPQDIPRLIHHIHKFHMVIGARQRGSQTHIHRNFANLIYNRLATAISGFKIEDLTSGFRVMRRRDALRFCDMFPNTFSYPTTSTLAFIRTGRSLKYVGIQTRYRIGTSKIRLVRDGINFLLIIVKIAMTFSPLRVFLPVSVALFALGMCWYCYTYMTWGRFTNMSHLLINSSVIVFMLGLVAEQISALRLERGDKLFDAEDQDQYAVFAEPEKTEELSS
jgi:glycosyltransferase involved in cell wall biosynthesis